MVLGNGIALPFYRNTGSLAGQAAETFRARVLAGGGTFEAYNCFVNAALNLYSIPLNTSNAYDEAKVIITPNGYKSGTLYAAKPTDGSVDLAWTRATDANRINSVGAQETMGSGVPRLDYRDNSPCPVILAEASRINLFLNSAILSTQSVTTAATAYTVSFEGTGTITFSGDYVGSLVGTGPRDRVSITFTPAAGSVTCTVTGTVTSANFEAGAYGTSWIPTLGITATRNADAAINSAIAITGGDFTVFFDQIIYARNTGFFDFQNAAATRVFYTAINTSGFFVVNAITGGGNLVQSTESYNAGDRVKAAIRVDSGVVNLFVNGVKNAVTDATTITDINRIFLTATGGFTPAIKADVVAIYPSAPTDADLIRLTTV